jgi:hypothetical protein
MRWLLRLLTLFVMLILLKTLISPQPHVFIAWSESQTWLTKIHEEMKFLQAMTQDLPTSIEAEMRRFFKDFRLMGNAQEV